MKAHPTRIKSSADGPPFERRFFATAFPERVRSLCEKRGENVPVVLLHLSDGCVLDLCHVEALTPRFLAAAVFRDGSDCAKMDVVFVPYELIARLTLSRREPAERRIGFQLEKSVPALEGGAETQNTRRLT